MEILLKKFLNNNFFATDETVAIEYCRYTYVLIQDRTDNITVTYPDDLTLANLYLSQIIYLLLIVFIKIMCIRHGFNLHRLKKMLFLNYL